MKRFASWLSGSAIIAFAAIGSYGYFRTQIRLGYHHRITDMVITNATVSAGDILHTETTVEREMPADCDINVSRFVMDAQTGEVVFSQVVPAVLFLNGQHVVRRTVTLPPTILPGHYLLQARTHSDCMDFQNTSSSPSVPFTVLPKESP